MRPSRDKRTTHNLLDFVWVSIRYIYRYNGNENEMKKKKEKFPYQSNHKMIEKIICGNMWNRLE